MTYHVPFTTRPLIPAHHAKAFALFCQLLKMGLPLDHARAIARASL